LLAVLVLLTVDLPLRIMNADSTLERRSDGATEYRSFSPGPPGGLEQKSPLHPETRRV
jgi:hypothetical protein